MGRRGGGGWSRTGEVFRYQILNKTISYNCCHLTKKKNQPNILCKIILRIADPVLNDPNDYEAHNLCQNVRLATPCSGMHILKNLTTHRADSCWINSNGWWPLLFSHYDFLFQFSTDCVSVHLPPPPPPRNKILPVSQCIYIIQHTVTLPK